MSLGYKYSEYVHYEEYSCVGTSLAGQWLRLYASTAGGTGSISGRGPEIPHAAQLGQLYIQLYRIKLRVLGWKNIQV